MNLTCGPGANAYARAYVFWHVWVFDGTTGTYVDQNNSGYLWDSGDVPCPNGGGTVSVGSPAMMGSFNSSSYLAAGTTFVAGDSYVFTFFLGCTAEADVGVTPASAGAFCNDASSPSSNAYTLGWVGVA